jgi:hypothetical protein
MAGEPEIVNDVKEQSVYFSSLKALWLSKIPLKERQSRFPDALEQIPSRLVTTSVFCNIFFPKVAKAIRGNLDAERAWFGIRSILKGGVLAVFHEGDYSVDDFAQLAPNNKQEQIPKKHTSEYFSDSELGALLKVYEEYQKWIKKKKFYDDIDLVLRALKHEEGSSAKRQIEKDKRFNESLTTLKARRRNAINQIRLNDSSVVFKKPAQKQLDKLSKRQDNLKTVYNWVNRNILTKKPFNKKMVKEIRNRHVDDTESGVPIHKSPLDSGGRIYWTPINNENKTCTIVIYDFCVTKEDGDPRLGKILKNYKHDRNPSNPREEDDEEFDDEAIPTDFSIDDTPCEGPVKPWPHSVKTGFGLTADINKESNIQLDDLQRETILSNQPLLIDGLAGTGKTSVLAYRGVVRAAVSSGGTTILVTASKDHVVQRISETMIEIKENGDWKDNEFEMNYVLAPGISNEKIPASSIDAFSATIPEEGYDEIILDESQDITVVEFEMLRRLLIGHNLRRLVFAGDPLQTLNPTGFDWNRIQAMFIEGEVSQNDLEITKFHNNYRSQRKIVEFANAVQTKRSRLFRDKNQTIMEAKKGGTDLVRIIRYDLSKDNHMTAISDIIADAGESKAVIVTPLSDDLGIKDLLSGKENQEGRPDHIMSNVWNRILRDTESEASIENFRKSLYLHSASSIKGAEYDIVVLYNFASSGQARKSLNSLLQNLDDIEPLGKEDGIRIRYEFSKLYVALTRAFDRIYLIEDQNGFDFWKDVKLYIDDELVGVDAFIDFNLYSDPLQAVNCEDLKPKIEANRENYTTQRNKFLKDPTNIIALEFAINLGKRLVKNINNPRDKIHNEILELEAEFAWYQSRQAGRDEQEKASLAEEALQKFTKAGLYNKATPIYFSQKRYKQCLENLPENSKKLIKLIRYVCQIKMPSSYGTPLRPDDEIAEDCISLLKEKKINVDDNWAKINPVDECKGIIRKWVLENCALSQILKFDSNNSVFTVTELSERFNEPRDVINILEDRKQTKTAKWRAIYNENVTDYISSITNVNHQNEEFYHKIEYIDIKDENIKKLRRTIDEKMLEAIPTLKNPSRDLAKVIQELEGYSAKIETNPNDIAVDQWRSLYLLQRIVREGTVDKFGIWNEIITSIGAQPTNSPFHWFAQTKQIEKLFVKILENRKAAFPKYKSLSWFNSENYLTLIDGYMQKMFREYETELDNEYDANFWINLHPKSIKQTDGTDSKQRLQPKEVIEFRKQFIEWFGLFFNYYQHTSFKANKDLLSEKLFRWTTLPRFEEHIDEEGKDIYTLLINFLPQKKLSEEIERFIIRYLEKDGIVESDDWKKLNKSTTNISKVAKKVKWERENSLFVDALDNEDFEIDQSLLKEYIKLLDNGGFVDQLTIAKRRVTLTDNQLKKELTTIWESDGFEEFFELYLQNQNRLEGNHLLFQLINNDSYYNDEEWWNKHAISTNVGLIVPEDMPLQTTLASVAISLLEADSIIPWLNRIEGLGLQEDDDCKNVIEAIIEDWLPTPKTKLKNTIGSIPHVERLSSFCFMHCDSEGVSQSDSDKLMGDKANFKTDSFEAKLEWIRKNQGLFFRLP